MKKVFFLGLMALCFLSAKAQYGIYSVQNKSNFLHEGLTQLLIDGLRAGTTTVTVEYKDDDPDSRSMKPEEEIDTATMLDVLAHYFEEEGVADELVRSVPTRVTISDTSIVVDNKDLEPMHTYRVLKVTKDRKKNGWVFHCADGVKIKMEQVQTYQGPFEVPVSQIPETQKVYRISLPDGMDLQIKLTE